MAALFLRGLLVFLFAQACLSEEQIDLKEVEEKVKEALAKEAKAKEAAKEFTFP
eukprot:CAMPEP_0197629606 /NCGR_PEP_ID=MMETSP1338-20131121/7390_1 /TAXON_ID=43686 ORGANISM="Pelagodinium beii, Strain RCC1491" /NCGR_SAMPLE_ID=MMETSP1338 /ASSEMBLY_ACC=CAM_ASM_000754 /LENGTH=53 /DNA_ID=CAMNT_0043200673 /DNA_START=64 /DNA_END=221 /DNA_ORIENTATION=+